ncbi:MAG: hypothetical protein J0L84_06725 [Verrucomicrobia bacterium]|nr:hypothetical protein [Verrucomicrobiota bacterium]
MKTPPDGIECRIPGNGQPIRARNPFVHRSRKRYPRVVELEKKPTRSVGRLTGTIWQRFNRLQGEAALLLGSRRHPGGVFRFKTYQELEAWNRQVSLQPREAPTKATSSGSAVNRARLGIPEVAAGPAAAVTIPRWLWYGVLTVATGLALAWAVWWYLHTRSRPG